MITTLQGKTLDKFERIAVNASFHRVIMRNSTTGAFELFSPEQLADGQSLTRHGEYLSERGASFYGVIGVVDGAVRTALEVPLDKPILDHLSKSFAVEFEVHADASARERVEQVVFARWLNRLVHDNTAEA